MRTLPLCREILKGWRCRLNADLHRLVTASDRPCGDVKTNLDKAGSDEAKIKFENKRQIQAFFGNAMKYGDNNASIQRIAKDVAPTYCPTKNAPKRSDQDFLQNLFSDIDSGKLAVVLKNSRLRINNEVFQDALKDQLFNFDLLHFAKKCADQIKAFCSKIVHSEYNVLEQEFHFDENDVAVPSVIYPSSVKEHSTGWTSWDDPFEISVLGLFKTFAAYNTATFLNLSNSIKLMAISGSQLELVSAQYFITGKSVVSKPWYGSFAIRYNLKTLSLEVAWVKFKGCGKEERILVELKRKDRLMFHKSSIYNHPEVLIPPFIPMEKYLSDYKNGFSPPEHNVFKPIKIG